MPALPRSAALALLAFLSAVLPGACARFDPQAVHKPMPPVAPGMTEPLRFDQLRLGSMRRGMIIGRYVFGFDCAPPYDDVYWTSGRNLREGSTARERFAEVMGDAGFEVTGWPGGDRLMEMDNRRARFAVQADLRSVQLDLCRRASWWTGSGQGDSGDGRVRVDWSVYDAASGVLTYRVTTTGVAHRDSGADQGDILLMEEAFASAAEGLSADAGFRTAVARGGAIVPTPTAAFAPLGVSSPAPGVSSAGEVVSSRAAIVSSPAVGVSTAPAAGGIVSSRAPEVSSAPPPPHTPGSPAVSLLHRAAPEPLLIIPPVPMDRRDGAFGSAAGGIRVGSGRGVAIGRLDGGFPDGQTVILTATAGPDATVTVIPARGVALDGQVVARDSVSGLALVRVAARLTALTVRAHSPDIGEAVTAVLDKGGRRAEGIVAALRPNDAGLVKLQADLSGPAPQAGDPLIDGQGRLLGLALPPKPLGGATGLADFTPAAAALRRMGARLTQAEAGSVNPPLTGSRPAIGSKFDQPVAGEADGDPYDDLDEDGLPPT